MSQIQQPMKNGTCPKCGSNEVFSNPRVRGGQSYPPYVDIMETEPPNRPFIWSPKMNTADSLHMFVARVVIQSSTPRITSP